MATVEDIGVSAAINILTALAFLLAFALLRIQPVNDRVYFPKWYIVGNRNSPRAARNFVARYVNLNVGSYFTFFHWMPQALRMSETELIKHAGLDSAVFLRAYTLGLKIFLPIAIVALLILVPVNVSSATLSFLRKELVVSDIDKLSISNVHSHSSRFFIHIALQYLFTFWTCLLLYKEYSIVASMRLNFLAAKERRAEQFTVLVRNVPRVSGKLVYDSVEQFFKTNYPNTFLCQQAVYNSNKFARLVKRRDWHKNWLDYYQLKYERNPDKKPTHKRGFLGLCGERVDSIDYYKEKVQLLEKNMAAERQKIIDDKKAILPVAFVSFNSRWGAAMCAQTQQSKNPTLWLTHWAPEPRDIYWRNLAIPYVSLNIRKILITILVFALIFFYMIPIAFVQSLANLEGLEKVAPFLRPVVELRFIKSFLQGFLPGLALNIFLYILPMILMIMSKVEGHFAISQLERKTAAKYYYFMLVNVFFGSIITGTAFQQLYSFLHQAPAQIPRTIGDSIPMKATFFITYIMVDGWAGIAAEILRLKPLIIYHLKNMLLAKTERDRERAMDPGSVAIAETIPTLQLYFLLGIVYAVVTPILLPFIVVFFAFAYLVYRHQIINVYNQEYESAAAFWPHIHNRFIASLMISHIMLLGLLSTKKAANSTPLLIVLPVLTLAFHKYCKNRFEPVFRKYSIEEAMTKDVADGTSGTDMSLKMCLADAYLHPIFRSFEEEDLPQVKVDKGGEEHRAISVDSKIDSPSPPHEIANSPPRQTQSLPPHCVYHSSSPTHHVYYPFSPPNYIYQSSPPHSYY